jgi:stage V sporulation protein K
MLADLLYNLSILLSFADVLAIPVGLVIAYAGYSADGIALPFGMATIPGGSHIMMVGGIILSVVALIAVKPLHEMRIFYRSKAEYDEFGRSKSKGTYERLSKKERDAIDLQTTADMERIVSSEVLKKITKEGSKNPDADMDELIGLKPVKDKMHEMVARMEFEAEDAKEKKKKKKKTPSLEETSFSGRHMVFTGSPGTGKTTIARIMTGFLYKYGYITENKCVEVDGNFLKAGEYTEQKVKMVVQRAFGGVLFIDEAYVLMYGAGAADAIATLIKQMEDNRGRFIVILAGYTNEMRELLESNPGFSSRIKEFLNFPDYNEKEMEEIFSFMAGKKGYTIDEDAYDIYDERIARERRLRSFGNARTARSVLDETLDRHALNYVEKKIDRSDKYVICPQDISTEIKDALMS